MLSLRSSSPFELFDRLAQQLSQQRQQPEPAAETGEGRAQVEKGRGPLLSEFRYGTWSRSFRIPQTINRDRLQAVYRDGLLTITAPKANTVSTLTVNVEG